MESGWNHQLPITEQKEDDDVVEVECYLTNRLIQPVGLKDIGKVLEEVPTRRSSRRMIKKKEWKSHGIKFD
jgi:hypothetical protein